MNQSIFRSIGYLFHGLGNIFKETSPTHSLVTLSTSQASPSPKAEGGKRQKEHTAFHVLGKSHSTSQYTRAYHKAQSTPKHVLHNTHTHILLVRSDPQGKARSKHMKKHEKTISIISSAIVPVRCRAPYGWTWACSCFPSKTRGSLRICCVQQPGRLCNPNSMKAVALWLGEAKRLHDGHASWRNPLTGNVFLVFFFWGGGMP